MGDRTKIEWCTTTWNPITGCTPVSEGCLNCYAKAIWERFHKEPFSQIQLHPEHYQDPLHWRKPREIFVCSMGDLFHEDIIPSEIAYAFEIMKRCPQHTFYVLTKRPENIEEILYGSGNNHFLKAGEYLSNVWLGVTAENQRTADERIPILLSLPGWKKFISFEPMLEGIDLMRSCDISLDGEVPAVAGIGNFIHWVICGAESGSHRRPYYIEWVRDLKDQCIEAGVPFFYKQGIGDDGVWRKMPVLDGRVWNQKPAKEKS